MARVNGKKPDAFVMFLLPCFYFIFYFISRFIIMFLVGDDMEANVIYPTASLDSLELL
jgi:hypothetical protein